MLDPVRNVNLRTYHKLVNQGYSQRKACEIIGIPRSTIQDAIKRGDSTAPKILLLDVETSPSIVATFGRFKQNIGQEQVMKEGGELLCACWKLLDEQEVHSASWNTKNDLHVVAALWDAIDSADVIVGQNIKGFDVPILKSRLVYWGLPPLKNVKVVDTLQIAKTMRFNSNKLDSLGAYLGLGRKKEHAGMRLWMQVLDGNAEALAEMLDYCKQDVLLLQEIYLALRAFDKQAPNMGNYYQDDVVRCSACGSAEVQKTGNSIYTAVSEFQELSCASCGHKMRTRVSLYSKEQRQNKVVSSNV